MRDLVFSLLFIGCLITSASAEIIEVLPDGTGDQPTIQAAIAIATAADEIVLGDGIFTGPGNRELDTLDKTVTIRSASGNPAGCILDCEADDVDQRRIMTIGPSDDNDITLSGLTFTGGHTSGNPNSGGAISIEGGSLTLRSCIFTANTSTAIYATSCRMQLEDCGFSDNSGHKGSALFCHIYCEADIIRCEFRNNHDSYGGAVFGHLSDTDFEDCLFDGNSGAWSGACGFIYTAVTSFTRCHFEGNLGGYVGAISLHGICEGDIYQSTFVENEAAIDLGAGAVEVSKSSIINIEGSTFWGNRAERGAAINSSEERVTMTNCIIAFTDPGRAVTAENGDIFMVCSDIFGNADGDWTEPIADQIGLDGNIERDPLFCDAEGGVFTLHGASPCLAENNDCGLMGAWGFGDCDQVIVEETNWSRLKSIY
ncbi:MAG: right-handed parallel beta-helix repeat-containing protein [bacterium]|nr:right-handed parallel beta-helix repeat-containing protein [bacterium]